MKLNSKNAQTISRIYTPGVRQSDISVRRSIYISLRVFFPFHLVLYSKFNLRVFSTVDIQTEDNELYDNY